MTQEATGQPFVRASMDRDGAARGRSLRTLRRRRGAPPARRARGEPARAAGGAARRGTRFADRAAPSRRRPRDARAQRPHARSQGCPATAGRGAHRAIPTRSSP
jgi:hypothetical protein